MLPSIRFSLLLIVTAPVLFLASELIDGITLNSSRSVFMKQDYSQQWKAVDEAVAEGLPKTALELVEHIYARAKREGNQPQIIRSISYRIALLAETSEEEERILIDDMEEEIASAEQPVRAVLTSMLAELYWNYYRMNRWRIGERTELSDRRDSDFRTWTPAQFFDTTRNLYLESIEPAELLQRTAVETFAGILHRKEQSEVYRPTMYDILAHRALSFFNNDEANLPTPQRDFELEGVEALLPASAFVAHEFSSPNPRNMKYHALLLYQKLLRFHLGKADDEAIVDLDLQRLAVARELSWHEDKDTTYYRAVQSLYDAHADAPISTLAGVALARYHYEGGDYVSAHALCEREIGRYPDSRGAADSRALLAGIVAKELSLAVEVTSPPDTPFLMSVGYRNVPKVYFRIIRLTAEEDNEQFLSRGNASGVPEHIVELLQRGSYREWAQELPAQSDFKKHQADLAGPELPLGVYMLLMSPYEDFRVEQTTIAHTFLRITRLSLQSLDTQQGSTRFWVTDAIGGAPLRDVHVRMFTHEWNPSTHQTALVGAGSTRTDGNGLFVLEAGRFRRGVSFRLSHAGDTLTVLNTYNAYARGPERTQRRTMLFTDRSIYRPGQTVYLKGVVMEGNSEQADFAVVKQVDTEVEFRDANNQRIHTVKVRTNDYGSFHTSFTVPSGVLTGMMSIRSAWGSTSIRVEEYRRPKFEVLFKPVEGEYRLDGSVTVQGEAKAYAGSNIDGAAVQWRVVRRVRFPYWFRWWIPIPQGSEREIAHGQSTTDADGSFTVEFTALPDRSVDPETLPVFTYEVTADVTDINGETHSANTSVQAGYTSIELSIDVAGTIDATVGETVRLSARNLGGQPMQIRGTVRIEELRPPDRVLRSRVLPEPDSWVMTQEEFTRSFPHDVYRNENQPGTWPVRRTVTEREYRTGEDGVDSLALRKLVAGRYRIVMHAKDPGGRDLEIRKIVTVYEPGAEVPSQQTDFFVDRKTRVEPGDEALFYYGSAYDGVHVLARMEHRTSDSQEQWRETDGRQLAYRYTVEEKHRGGFTVQLYFVQHYRLYQRSVFVAVPWTNKELQIETATFRDKLRPGQQEEWRITIKGRQRDRVAAEALAAMYDASLDAIYMQQWPLFSWPTYGSWSRFSNYGFGSNSARMYVESWNPSVRGHRQEYDRLNLFLLEGYGSYYGYGRLQRNMTVREGAAHFSMAMEAPAAADGEGMVAEDVSDGEVAKSKRAGVSDEVAEQEQAVSTEGLDAVQTRTNFNETAFFYPDLMTDTEGNVVLRFTAPEALTRWKLRLFAHTPDLKTGYLEKTTVTQKELMVMPNMPRFLRNGDDIVLMTRISNLSEETLSGQVRLQLFDAVSMQPLDERFGLHDAVRSFTAEKGRGATAHWSVSVPEDVSAVVYRIVAQAGEYSDGEEMALPVLPNRMLVTETLPLNIRGGETKTFTFDKLLASGSSSTLRQHQLTLEMTSQPAWYAVQALPYLMEYPYDCSEQIFNRFYANSIAGHIAQSNPRIKRVFDQWRNTDALLSNLQKNEDLKMLLLEETPWVLQGKDETERKKRIALLFDLNTMGNNLDAALRKLEKAQSSNGGWPWFPGMPEGRYITQYIVAGFGHLDALGVTARDERVSRMLRRAVQFIDERMNADYQELKRREGGSFDGEKDYLSYLAVQYLYARSYFPTQQLPGQYQEAMEFWRGQARSWWVRHGFMSQGQIALALHRDGDTEVPRAIVRSLSERALQSDEMGMYWKYERGWYWYQAPIETQALLIEVFDEVAGDMASVEEMKIWLLKQKQVQDWGSTVATAEACYALLRRGSDLLASDKLVEVRMGGELVDPKAMGADVEAGTGYYRVDWRGGDIRPEQGTVVVRKEDQGIAWGAVYWQYFEQLDRITPASSPLKIEKTLFLRRNTEQGQVLTDITPENVLGVGDVVMARITLRVDRDMEYVHLKDMRGSGFELINQLSGYQWKGGLGYYEAPKDASVNFFFHRLRKGVHVFEYPLRVSHAGRFSNGISSIQCMYAPEFAAHSEGIVVNVE